MIAGSSGPPACRKDQRGSSPEIERNPEIACGAYPETRLRSYLLWPGRVLNLLDKKIFQKQVALLSQTGFALYAVDNADANALSLLKRLRVPGEFEPLFAFQPGRSCEFRPARARTVPESIGSSFSAMPEL